jgi:hypothetical protein
MATTRKRTTKKRRATSSGSRKRATKRAPSRRKTSAKKTGARKAGASKKKRGAKRYGSTASKKVKSSMHEMKRGELSSGRSKKKVRSRKQAIAIGLSEARRAGGKVPPRRSSR